MNIHRYYKSMPGLGLANKSSMHKWLTKLVYLLVQKSGTVCGSGLQNLISKVGYKSG